ncbi:hypothetical protein ACN4GS_09940 [Burkholderia pseudomallei]|uniref:hypothetical protein n=1 Tax=Burkholderia pseudomallei TaxID=28450 RepID=UPI003AF9F74A
MSNSQKIKIPRSSDKKISQIFIEIGKKIDAQNVTIGTLALFNITAPLTEEPGGDWATLLEQDSCLIDTMEVSSRGLSIRYARGGQVGLDVKSPMFDEIILSQAAQNGQQPALPNASKLEIVAFISNALNPFDPARAVTSNILSNEQNQLLAIHNSTLERLEQINGNLIQKSVEFRDELDRKFNDKVDSIESEYTEKKRRLDEDVEARVAEVDEKQRQLDEKLKIIDDRDNTHARRQIRDRMLDDVKQRINQFGVSETTSRKRTPVLIGMVGLIIVFLSLLVWTGHETNVLELQDSMRLQGLRDLSSIGADKLKAQGFSPETIAKVSVADVDRRELWWPWSRFALLSLGLAGSVIYYIKWQNRWAEQHITSEFQLQQFYIDVNRANWIVESCLEWRKAADSDIPDELLKSIAGNLFVNNQGEPDRVIHPADELASALLGTASKLKLKIGDNELDFDKPSKIAKKEIKSSSSPDKAD